MAITVEAVYEDGVLKPTQPLPLKEHDRVQITVHPPAVEEAEEAEELPVEALSSDQPRPYGLCAGEFTVPDDFDQPLPEEFLRDFEGR